MLVDGKEATEENENGDGKDEDDRMVVKTKTTMTMMMKIEDCGCMTKKQVLPWFVAMRILFGMMLVEVMLDSSIGYCTDGGSGGVQQFFPLFVTSIWMLFWNEDDTNLIKQQQKQNTVVNLYFGWIHADYHYGWNKNKFVLV